eukprot:gene19701-biopygen2520
MNSPYGPKKSILHISPFHGELPWQNAFQPGCNTAVTRYSLAVARYSPAVTRYNPAVTRYSLGVTRYTRAVTRCSSAQRLRRVAAWL